MSHIAKYGTSLKGVDRELMRSAFEVVAKKLGGTVVKSITNYSGGRVTQHDGVEFFAALKTGQLPQGIALVLDDGNAPSFVALTDQGNSAIAAFKKEIEFTYKTLAMHVALTQMGYQVNPGSFDGGALLEGEKH